MAKGARTWILPVVLVAGAASWLFSQEATRPTSPPATATPATKAPGNPHYPTPAPPYPGAKNWTLIVGPNACDVKENGKDVPVAVINRGTHSIKYQSNAKQPLGIVFHAPPTAPTADAPFKNMTFGGTDDDGSYLWVLNCKGDVCSTGPAIAGSKGGYWKTDQILAGQPRCDAGIIIQP